MIQGTQTTQESISTLAPPSQRVRRRETNFLTSMQSLAATIVIAVFVITFIVQAFQIPSESMENTLLIGDYLLVDKVHFAQHGRWPEIEPYSPVRRGDIVVFRYPVNPTQHFVKRVIGLPGDHIRLVNKKVYVNGTLLREPYVIYQDRVPDSYRDDFPDTDFLNANVNARWWTKLPHLIHDGELVVPPNDYFVLGDNRDQSLDSRYWGFVPRENIEGRPLLIYWSMRRPEVVDVPGVPATFSDKLIHFAYTLSHFLQETRWDRTFRLIK